MGQKFRFDPSANGNPVRLPQLPGEFGERTPDMNDTHSVYRDLMDAINILRNARMVIYQEDGTSPAWEMVNNAANKLDRQAKAALRGQEQSC